MFMAHILFLMVCVFSAYWEYSQPLPVFCAPPPKSRETAALDLKAAFSTLLLPPAVPHPCARIVNPDPGQGPPVFLSKHAIEKRAKFAHRACEISR